MYTTKYGIRPVYNWWTKFVLSIPLIRELYSTEIRLMLKVQDKEGKTLNWYETICRVFNTNGLSLYVEYVTCACIDRCDVAAHPTFSTQKLRVEGFTPHGCCRATRYTATIQIFKDNG